MKPIVYIDTLFLINLIFNMLIFYMSTYILKKEIKALRIFLVSVFSALYGVCVFFPDLSIFYNGLSKLLFMVLFAKILFASKGIKPVLKESLVCFFVSIGFCGGICALITVTGAAPALGMVISGGILYLDIDPLVLLFGIIVSLVILIFFSSSCEEAGKNEELINEFIITAENKTFKVRALSDTGCALSEPEHNLPVIIVEKGFVFEIAKNLFLTYSSVTKDNESLAGFIPEKITDKTGKILYKAVVAEGKDCLDTKGRFNAVVNPEIFNYSYSEDRK